MTNGTPPPSTPASTETLPKKIISIGDLLADSTLTIPQYQRPYKWMSKNINQLFSDIATHKNKSSYRLGTIVFHKDKDGKNIVDGQQRTITLLLAVRALIKLRREKLDRKDLKEQLTALEKDMVNPSFTSASSKANIHSNYSGWRQNLSREINTQLSRLYALFAMAATSWF